MAEIVLPIVITAIADASTEGFIAGTLFGQGWSVVFRALDAESLGSYIESTTENLHQAVLIYSPDLPGITCFQIENYESVFRQVVGFSHSSSSQFPRVLAVPKSETELLNCIRGSVRSPLIRSQAVKSQHRRAKVIGIASPAGSTGCTTIAINLAMEMSILGKETLLVDADVRSPSIASLLGIHNLDKDQFGCDVATNFKACEFTQAKSASFPSFLDDAVRNFDCLVLDLGSIEELSDSLTDRRWGSTLIHWASESADEIIFVGKSDPLSLHRFESLIRSLSGVTISARISCLLNMQSAGRKRSSRDGQFIAICAPLRPHRMLSVPRDVSTVGKAEVDRATLIEVSDKSRLRKAILKLAVELQS